MLRAIRCEIEKFSEKKLMLNRPKKEMEEREIVYVNKWPEHIELDSIYEPSAYISRHFFLGDFSPEKHIFISYDSACGFSMRITLEWMDKANDL